MPAHPPDLARLGRSLVLDELFDLSLYRVLRDTVDGPLRRTLDELIPIETKHFAFWQRFFGIQADRLGPGRRLKLAVLIGLCRLFGAPAVHLVLEAIEVHGVRKYLTVWERYRGQPLGEAVREVLHDELSHEDQVVSEAAERRIDAESIRNLFLGFNDGLVEILGAVSGFFAAFADAGSILAASATVAVAGSFSMGAGAYVAAGSEREIRRLEEDRQAFLGQPAPSSTSGSALRATVLVALSYLLGAIVPVLPVLLGARTVTVSLVAGGVVAVIVSAILAFLSGMQLRRRLLTNLAILGAAVAVTYAVGLAARALWGISVS